MTLCFPSLGEMAEKEERWAESFDIYVGSNIRGKWTVSDMKRVVAFYDSLSRSDQIKFEREVDAETRRRYDEIFGKSDESDDDGVERDGGGDEVEVLATFNDIDRVNEMMNEVLSCAGDVDDVVFPPPPPPIGNCNCCRSVPKMGVQAGRAVASRGKKRSADRSSGNEQTTRF